MKHVITALVENQPGVLARIVGLISGRGYNIESLNVAPTHDPTVSRVTLMIDGDDRDLEQVTKQMNKLVDVIKVADMTRQRFVSRELVMVEVNAPGRKRAEVGELAKLLDAKVAAVCEKSVVLQMVGDSETINDFIRLLRSYGIMEIARTGILAMGKAEQEKTNNA